MNQLRRFLAQLLYVDAVRVAVASLRWLYFTRLRHGLRTAGSPDAASRTVAHNLRSMGNLAVHRSLVLIRPLAAAVSIARHAEPIERRSFANEIVLSIGPRTEGELLLLVSHGFRASSIRGLDLISYSPWIDVGDIHRMRYEDDSFSVILAGWVLAYSDNKPLAASEIVRVAKPGAIIAIGVEYCALDNEQLLLRDGYLAGSAERIDCLDDIVCLFDGHIDQVFFRHDITEVRREEEVVALVLVFSLLK